MGGRERRATPGRVFRTTDGRERRRCRMRETARGDGSGRDSRRGSDLRAQQMVDLTRAQYIGLDLQKRDGGVTRYLRGITTLHQCTAGDSGRKRRPGKRVRSERGWTNPELDKDQRLTLMDGLILVPASQLSGKTGLSWKMSSSMYQLAGNKHGRGQWGDRYFYGWVPARSDSRRFVGSRSASSFKASADRPSEAIELR